MNSSTLKSILLGYEKKRNKYELDAEDRKKNIYAKEPRLSSIDESLAKISIATAKSLLIKNDKHAITSLKNQTDNLLKEKDKILHSIGIDKNYFLPNYDCKKCNDTGYYYENFSNVMCNCLKQKLFDIQYNKSNIYNLQNQNFDNFDINLYSDKIDVKKYNGNISPRENITIIKNICNNFINNFSNKNQKNLFFTGNTGLGKTFLSSCIANEILKKEFNVLYQTCSVMLDTIINYRFNKLNSSQELYNSILISDLLIIDDLGTEGTNTMKLTELFNVINTRILNCKKTIISTNLSLQNLFDIYDERIVSRIVGNYDICYFFGEDIRFKK